jgi:hypothetical protein
LKLIKKIFCFTKKLITIISLKGFFRQNDVYAEHYLCTNIASVAYRLVKEVKNCRLAIRHFRHVKKRAKAKKALTRLRTID